MRSALSLVPAIAIAALIAALPAVAAAEGARTVLDCTADDGSASRFVFAPTDIDEFGAGDVAVSVDDGHAAAGYAGSFLGPFIWNNDTDQYTLIIDREGENGRVIVLLHRLHFADSPLIGQMLTLTCEINL